VGIATIAVKGIASAIVIHAAELLKFVLKAFVAAVFAVILLAVVVTVAVPTVSVIVVSSVLVNVEMESHATEKQVNVSIFGAVVDVSAATKVDVMITFAKRLLVAFVRAGVQLTQCMYRQDQQVLL
jgi:hypothetical protein